MKFLRTTRYPGGALGEITNAIAEIQSSLEQLKAVYPIHLRPQGNSASIEFFGDYGGGGSIYSSYFTVIDASTYDENGTITLCKIGVTDGGTTVSGSCGTVKINGYRANVTAIAETITDDGVYHVWIHSWIDAEDGPAAEIIVGTADDDTPPDNPNGGIAFANQLAGRVTVLDGAIASITQDYLRGGEHFELLYGDCAGEDLTP
jgi:hypothetical protein